MPEEDVQQALKQTEPDLPPEEPSPMNDDRFFGGEVSPSAYPLDAP